MAKLIVQGVSYYWPGVEKMLNSDAILIEDRFGWTAAELEELLDRGSIKAVTAIVWVLRRRDEPALSADDISFTIDEVQVEPDTDEVGEKPDAERPKDPSLGEAPPSSEPEPGPGDDAETPEPSGEPTTSDPSPSTATVHHLTQTG